MKKKKNHAGSIRSDVCDALYAAEGGGCKKAVWKDVDGVWYAHRGSKLVRNKWVGDYYAGPDGSLEKPVDWRIFCG